MGNEFRGIRSKTGTTAEFVMMTPELAAKWREQSQGANFRNLDLKRLASLEGDVVANGWQDDGMPLRIINGKIADGQHRLEIIIRLKLTVELLVVRIKDETAILVMDTGKPRAAQDFITWKGIANANSVAAAARLIIQYKEGHIHASSSTKATAREVFMLAMSDKKIREFAVLGRHLGINFIPQGEVAWLAYAAAEHGLEKEAIQFFTLVGTGAGMMADDPALLLRNTLMANRSARSKMESIRIRAYMVMAWGKWLRGERVSFLRWGVTGPKSDGRQAVFPELCMTIPQQEDLL